MTRKLWWWSGTCATIAAYGTASCALLTYRAAYIGMSATPWWQTPAFTGFAELMSSLSNRIIFLIPGADPLYRTESLVAFAWPMLLATWIIVMLLWCAGLIVMKRLAKSDSRWQHA